MVDLFVFDQLLVNLLPYLKIKKFIKVTYSILNSYFQLDVKSDAILSF